MFRFSQMMSVLTKAMMDGGLTRAWDWVTIIPKLVESMDSALESTLADNNRVVEYIKSNNINVTVMTFTTQLGWIGRKLRVVKRLHCHQLQELE